MSELFYYGIRRTLTWTVQTSKPYFDTYETGKYNQQHKQISWTNRIWREKLIQKMNFYCFHCGDTFDSSNEAIKHLKRVHFLIDNSDSIKCVVRHCEKTYNTFKGLSNHLKVFDHSIFENVCFFQIICAMSTWILNIFLHN